MLAALERVIDFWDAGGGTGLGLEVTNQTLPADSLRLTAGKKRDRPALPRALDEPAAAEPPPLRLPASSIRALRDRRASGGHGSRVLPRRPGGPPGARQGRPEGEARSRRLG